MFPDIEGSRLLEGSRFHVGIVSFELECVVGSNNLQRYVDTINACRPWHPQGLFIHGSDEYTFYKQWIDRTETFHVEF